MEDAAVAGSDAVAASAAPPVPRLDLSNRVDSTSQSATQLAMKNALEGRFRGAESIDVAAAAEASRTLPEISGQRPMMIEEAQGPSTPTSARSPAAAPVEADTCTICAGSLGENGGTLSLLCGEYWREKKEFFTKESAKTDGR